MSSHLQQSCYIATAQITGHMPPHLSLSRSLPSLLRCPSAFLTFLLKVCALPASFLITVSGPLPAAATSLSKFSLSKTRLKASGASAWPARTSRDLFIRIVPDPLVLACGMITIYKYTVRNNNDFVTTLLIFTNTDMNTSLALQ